MLSRKAIHASSWLIVLAAVHLCGCAKPPAQALKEEPVPLNSAAFNPLPVPKEIPKLPPPTLEQVQEAVKRVFKDSVVIDASRAPSYFVGDFNGDQSQDLAIVLKPAAGKLQELNQEFPNWLAREPMKLVLARSKPLARPAPDTRLPNPAAGQTVRFEQSDVLLAVIHGYGPKGWHDPEATQTHLLRDVVGANMRIQPLSEAAKAYKGIKPFPAIYGDLIQETLVGQPGFLHFAGSTYSWYDPRNYKPVIVPTHGTMSKMR
jgi:hypothetical protein